MLQQPPYELAKGQTLIHNKYTVEGKLGATSCSTVHAISMIKGHRQVIRVIKQSSKVKEPQISTEVSVLKQITEGSPDEVGFSKIYQYGYETDYHYLVLSLLGPNLQQLLKLCGGIYSLKTTMIVALQILDRLQIVHSYGFVYGDIAPENFLVGLGSQSPFIFMVDFGRCKRFKNKLTGQHITYKQNVGYSFNPVFGSINAHSKIQASRRDDIQSLLYMLVYLQGGKLPWNKPNDQKRGKTEINIGEMKKRVTPQMLCHKMPLEFIDLMYYVKCIEFYQKPDYEFIRKTFYRCLQQQGDDLNIVYDWNKLEEIDFKVYSGEPRIIIKQGKDKLIPPLLPKQADYNFDNQQKSSKSDIEEDDEASRLVIN